MGPTIRAANNTLSGAAAAIFIQCLALFGTDGTRKAWLWVIVVFIKFEVVRHIIIIEKKTLKKQMRSPYTGLLH